VPPQGLRSGDDSKLYQSKNWRGKDVSKSKETLDCNVTKKGEGLQGQHLYTGEEKSGGNFTSCNGLDLETGFSQ